jgi:hypothetical protein
MEETGVPRENHQHGDLLLPCFYSYRSGILINGIVFLTFIFQLYSNTLAGLMNKEVKMVEEHSNFMT